MTNDPQQPPAGSDPLAVLEELLAKQKASSGGASGGMANGQPSVPGDSAAAPEAGPTPEEEKVAKLEELHKLEEEAAARDQVMLEAQVQKFEEVKGSPQYQARVSQEKDIKDKKTQHKDDNEGFEIFQLETKKIAVPTEQNVSDSSADSQ